MSPYQDSKLQDSTEEPTKGTPIFESNPKEDEDNPRYIVSRQIGIIEPEVKELPPPEDIPRYIVTQEPADEGQGPSSEDS